MLNILGMWIYLLECYNLQPQPLEDLTVEQVPDDVEIEADEHTDAFVVSSSTKNPREIESFLFVYSDLGNVQL